MSLCLLMPSVLCIDGFGELGERGKGKIEKVRWYFVRCGVLQGAIGIRTIPSQTCLLLGPKAPQ